MAIDLGRKAGITGVSGNNTDIITYTMADM